MLPLIILLYFCLLTLFGETGRLGEGVRTMTRGRKAQTKNEGYVLIFHSFVVTLSQNKQNKRK